jgi:hypothetical protein
MVDLRLIQTADFILVNPGGVVDAQRSKQKLARIAEACQEQDVDRVLLDLRDVQSGARPVFAPADLAALVDTFHEMGFARRQRLGVLYKVDPHHDARMFAFIGGERGWNVKAFDNYEDALSWLAVSGEALESGDDMGGPEGEEGKRAA